MTTRTQPHTSGASFSLSPQAPSFTSYSSENIADIAARVVKELNLSQSDPYDDDFYSSITYNGDSFNDPPQSSLQNDTVQLPNDIVEEEQENGVHSEEDEDEDDESEFEFAILTRDENSSPISADEIFDNGQIKPMFPIFNTDLVFGSYDKSQVTPFEPQTTVRLPLRKLLEERETGAVSSSSSEADDLEGVPPETYCVWTPKKKEEAMMMKKKSKSTGSESKRWRFRDLLHRSNSDGKDTFVFLALPTHHKTAVKGGGSGGDGRREKAGAMGGRRKGDAGKNKKSYLPYRQDLVGLFANVNGISRTVRPF